MGIEAERVDRWYSAERDQSWFFRADRLRRDRGRPLGVSDMVEMERDLPRCGYATPWGSQVCGEMIPCPEHDGVICQGRGCSNQATGGCNWCGMLVCGFPVCAEHTYCKRHGS